MTTALPARSAPQRTSSDADRGSLGIAARRYYWKPGKAFLHAFELEHYATADLEFRHRILDLGCGDGTFASMLRERGVLDFVDVGLDHSLADLVRNQTGTTASLVRGDVRNLPFESGAFATVFSNAVICCVPTSEPGDIDRMFCEVRRVLGEGGLFVLTVATPSFDQNLPIAQLLRRAAGAPAAQSYLARLRRRLTHYMIFDEKEWVRRLDSAGFRIEQIRRYFTPRQARWWNILSLHGSRALALLKLARSGWLAARAARAQERTLRRVFERERASAPADGGAGYILIAARKPGGAAQ